MIDVRLAPYAVAMLRIALGIMFLAHSVVLKFWVFSLPGTAQFFISIGLPGWSAYLIFTAEVIGGLMLVFGVQARWAALALSPILIGATWTHWGNGWVFSDPNGGFEYPLYLILLSFVQVLLGDGAFALSRSRLPSWLAADRAVARA